MKTCGYKENDRHFVEADQDRHKYYKHDNEKLGTLLQKDQEQTEHHHFYLFELSV